MTHADSLRVVADSLQAAAVVAERIRASEVIESWHEFYLLAGTAAVTLVGLLFVSLSFNLEALLHESRAHVLSYARSTLLNFTYVLVVSLGFLIPNQHPGLLAVLIGIASAAVGTVHVVASRRSRDTSGAGSDATTEAFERRMRRRGRIYTICYAIAFVNAVALFVTRVPELTYNMVGLICMLLGNSMGISWDLLVEVGKLKAEMARQGEIRK